MRSEIIAMVCFVRKKFVQNMVRVEEYVRENVIVHVGSQLRRRGIVGGIQAESDSTSHRCFDTLSVGRIGVKAQATSHSLGALTFAFFVYLSSI